MSYLILITDIEQNKTAEVAPIHNKVQCPTSIDVHAALFDELERQGIHAVDIGKLTYAVVKAQEAIRIQYRPSSPRCANGACDE